MTRLFLLFLAPVLLSAQIHHYWYAATAPECPSAAGLNCSAYPIKSAGGYINVYDIDANFNLVATITLKNINSDLTDVQAIRGIFANVAADLFCLPNYGTTNLDFNTTSARLACFSLSSMFPSSTHTLTYDVNYSLAAIDRACISDDGSTIYAPAGEIVSTATYGSDWYVIRASTGSQTGLIRIATGA